MCSAGHVFINARHVFINILDSPAVAMTYVQPLARARREGCLVAFQAAWRGRRARAEVAPALAVRRRELEERRRMFEEERLAECVVALEAERREVEAKLQVKELNGMR